MSNIFKTTILLTGMTLLLMLAGRAFGGLRHRSCGSLKANL